jgi:diadenylate cyclase
MDSLADLPSLVAVEPTVLLDILLTAVLIYGVMSLIQGTRAVRLIIGAIILLLIYAVAQELGLRLLSGIMQAGAVVALVAFVVIFQPELRRGLDRLGRVGSWRWLAPVDKASHQRVASLLAASAARLARRRAGALIVVERTTGLGDIAETGVALHADLSSELLTTIFAAGYPLHDGAVIVRGDRIEAASVMLPMAERDASLEDYGTRHRAAMGISEQTDAVVIVVSEESGIVSLAEGGRFIRDLDEHELRQRLYGLLSPVDVVHREQRPQSAEPTTADAPGAANGSTAADRSGGSASTANTAAPETVTRPAKPDAADARRSVAGSSK